jgi:hypothetical protein
MRITSTLVISVVAGALVFLAPSSAPAIVVGTNLDIHQDIENQALWPNDFHVEGRVCSHGSPPVVLDHVDGPFPNFSISITPDTVHGDCWYIVKVDWSGFPGYIPYCTVLHLGIFLDVDSENVIADLVGWWTRDGRPIPNGGRNAGYLPTAGFLVVDYIGEPKPPEGQFLRLTNGNQDGLPGPGEIPGQIVEMEVVPIPPGQLEAMLGPHPFQELRLGGMQEMLPWIPLQNWMGPLNSANPQPFTPDSFFDVFLELSMPPGTGTNQWGVVAPFTVEPGGFLVVRQLLEFTNNAGVVEWRWAWEIHGAILQQLDFGDAPEGALAYPATGIIGMFPTCRTVGPASWIQHTNFGAWFGPSACARYLAPTTPMSASPMATRG